MKEVPRNTITTETAACKSVSSISLMQCRKFQGGRLVREACEARARLFDIAIFAEKMRQQ